MFEQRERPINQDVWYRAKLKVQGRLHLEGKLKAATARRAFTNAHPEAVCATVDHVRGIAARMNVATVRKRTVRIFRVRFCLHFNSWSDYKDDWGSKKEEFSLITKSCKGDIWPWCTIQRYLSKCIK